jgi:hypothetical protein
MIKVWAMHRRQNPIQVAGGLSILTAALALGFGVTREDFVRDAGKAYDEAQRLAKADGVLLVGGDGSLL